MLSFVTKRLLSGLITIWFIATATFFAMHAGIVVALFVLTLGFGMAPRPGAAGRVFFWTVVSAVCVGLLDWIVGANYFYLRDKPSGSLLDWFGPWPVYILGALVILITLGVGIGMGIGGAIAPVAVKERFRQRAGFATGIRM